MQGRLAATASSRRQAGTEGQIPGSGFVVQGRVLERWKVGLEYCGMPWAGVGLSIVWGWGWARLRGTVGGDQGLGVLMGLELELVLVS